MQFDQLLRRLTWRARRQLRGGADNAPIVAIEPPHAAAPHSGARSPLPAAMIVLGLVLVACAALVAG